MRYFDEQFVANSRPHQQWWEEVGMEREWFHRVEENLATIANASPILPREAWQELDETTRRVMRNDEGQVFMADLMALARPVHIGKLVHMTRVSSDAGQVFRSMSGQVPISMDKVQYDFRGAPVPIFATAFGREWREWNTLQSNNFDALADDQEAHTAKLRRNMAIYALDGDNEIVVAGYQAYGLRNHPLTKKINLGSAVGGANIDLSSFAATSDDIDEFFTNYLGKVLDDNLVTGKVNLYVSPEIGRRLDATYSGSSGYKGGTLLSYLLTNRRIGKIAVTFELSGNSFFGFVPSSDVIQPLVGMAVNTTAKARHNPTDNYQFLLMGAMGITIKADYNGKCGVFTSVVQN